jgi:hypothetical protein
MRLLVKFIVSENVSARRDPVTGLCYATKNTDLVYPEFEIIMGFLFVFERYCQWARSLKCFRRQRLKNAFV